MRRRTQEVLDQLAANVRALRVHRRLTQDALAEATEYDVRLIQYVEAGERNLTIDSLVAFADALGVPPHELLTPATSKDRERGRTPKTP